MNNNPIGWPDNGFNYDSSTQTLNVPRRLAINAPASYTGNLLDFTASGATRLRFSRKVSAFPNTCYGFYIPGAFPDAYGEDGYFFGDTASTKHGMSTRYASSSYGICFWGLGVAYAAIANDGFYVSAQLGFASGSALTANPDTFLVRDGAAHTLAMQRTTNPQTYRIYNTYTSATNYERGKLEWSGNVFNVGTEKGSGGGTARSMALQTDATDRLTLDTVGSVRVTTGLTVATLPAAPTVGMIARVTNALSPTIGSTVAGGGAANALCWYNGTNWTVLGI